MVEQDAYDLFAVNMVTSMLGVVFWQNATHSPGKIPSKADTAIKVSTSTGTVIGQVGFGKATGKLIRSALTAS